MMTIMGIPIQIIDYDDGDYNRQVLGILLNTNFWTLKVYSSSMIILLLIPLVKSSFSPIYKKRDRFNYKIKIIGYPILLEVIRVTKITIEA